MIIIEAVIFLLSSLISFSVSYFHLAPTIIQEIVLALFVIVLIISRRFLSPNRTSDLPFLIKGVLLLLSTVFVQLLVVSSGGFSSPFLILFYLFTLGLSLFIKLHTAIMFLIFSVALLFSNLFIATGTTNLFQQDPATALLYIISFLTVIPLSVFLARTYSFQNTVSSLLARHVQLAKRREELIMVKLDELIVVTDPSLNIISANEAVEKALQTPLSTIVNQPFLETIRLENSDGKPASIANLSIDQALLNKTTYLIEGFSLYYQTNILPKKVNIQVSPLTDMNGVIVQLVFVINNSQSQSKQKQATLEQTRIKHKAIIENLKKALTANNQQEIKMEIEALGKIGEDLFTAIEVGDPSFKPRHDLQDIALVCQNTVSAKEDFAKSLNVGLQFGFSEEEVEEKAIMDLTIQKTPKEMLPYSAFSSPTDITWFTILMQKLLDMATLIASGTKNSLVEITVTHPVNNRFSVIITIPSPFLSEQEQQQLFEEYYGQIGTKTNLRLGSGLEGYIAKNISAQLNIPIQTKYVKNSLEFILSLSQLPSSS